LERLSIPNGNDHDMVDRFWGESMSFIIELQQSLGYKSGWTADNYCYCYVLDYSVTGNVRFAADYQVCTGLYTAGFTAVAMPAGNSAAHATDQPRRSHQSVLRLWHVWTLWRREHVLRSSELIGCCWIHVPAKHGHDVWARSMSTWLEH
jgi:hypothetical protein